MKNDATQPNLKDPAETDEPCTPEIPGALGLMYVGEEPGNYFAFADSY